MEIQLGEENAKLYSKHYVSRVDIGFARSCAAMLLKKGWHAQPWERRGTIYFQQSAFTSALVVAYCRPFTKTNGWKRLSFEMIAPNAEETALHEQLRHLRDKAYAHSDSESYSVIPYDFAGFKSPMVSQPALRLSAEDLTLFQSMSRRLLDAINEKMNELWPR